MARKNDEVYFFDLLKLGITDSSMSVGGRAWSILVGAVGMVIADPVMFIFNKLEIKENRPYDPDDPNGPCNTNY